MKDISLAVCAPEHFDASRFRSKGTGAELLGGTFGYLADVLDRIHDHKIDRLNETLPLNWTPKAEATPENAAA